MKLSILKNIFWIAVVVIAAGCSHEPASRAIASKGDKHFTCEVDFQEWSDGGLTTFYSETTPSVAVKNGIAKLSYEGKFAKVDAEIITDGFSITCIPLAGIHATNGTQFGEIGNIHYSRLNVKDTAGVFMENKLGSIKVSCQISSN